MSLGNLTKLQDLTLYRNEISGELPSSLGNLTGLQVLWLGRNRFEGPLPSRLWDLTDLKLLFLGYNRFSGELPPSLGNLVHLEQLWVGHNQFSGELPSSMVNLSSLQRLGMPNTQLCAPTDAAFQTWLRGIEIRQGVVNCTTDRDVLVAFYDATDGPNWKNNTNWLSDTPTGEWYGVTTDASGRVTHLDLRENRLSGALPSSLGNLTKLQDLTLYRNEISGELPSSLGNLTELKVLWLGRNRFEGPLPSRLWDLTGLKLLFLGYNRFSGELPSSLGNLVHLEQLWVGHNQFSGKLPSSMVNLTSLQRIGMPNTQLCAPTDAAFQTWLRGIEIRQGVVNCEDTTNDYDSDNDGLIEISNLAQIDAIRYDLDGDGYHTNTAAYTTAFPNAQAGMGCPSTGCVGYELATDLDFDTNGNRQLDAGDTYWNNGAGWEPIGDFQNPYNATFDGSDHTIANMHIDREEGNVGLFGGAGRKSIIKRIGLLSANMYGGRVGGLIGQNYGSITDSYVIGSVSADGGNGVGGMVGYNYGSVTECYAIVRLNLSGSVNVGGLVGGNWQNGKVTASYSASRVSGGNNAGGLVGGNSGAVTACYSTGDLSSDGSHIGGLIGYHSGAITASYSTCSVTGRRTIGGLVGGSNGSTTASYWDTQLAGQTASAGGEGKTTRELQSFTSNTGIYASWDPAVWDFGTASQYPTLKGLGMSLTELDRAVLAALYVATDGPNWKNNANWLSDKPLGEWHGVTTDTEGRVTRLFLMVLVGAKGNGLNGRIPHAIGNLDKLTHLQLSNNQLSGGIPSSLGNLTNLRVLWLSRNRLSGQIPHSLGNLSNLIWLNLNRNRLGGQIPTNLGRISNLTRVYLAGNNLTGCIPKQWRRTLKLDGSHDDVGQLRLPFCNP